MAAGQTVAVARPGAIMPDGTQLGEAKLRGVKSSGMILAEDEVGIGDDHAEIMVLDDLARPGTPLAERCRSPTRCSSSRSRPNRPDCLAVYGVAREVHAITGGAAGRGPDRREDAEPVRRRRGRGPRTVEIDPEICLRFTARVFEDVKIGPSPLWLKQRLIAAGQRPISNVVDITNYVMLATGQPLHAFDLDKVRGGGSWCAARPTGEKMTTLDDVERDARPRAWRWSATPRARAGSPASWAAQISEVSDDDHARADGGRDLGRAEHHAHLEGARPAQRGQRRFEKQLHPELRMAAQRLAARLMVELCGARLVPGTIDEYPQPAAAARACRLRLRAHREAARRRGSPTTRSRAILDRLGFELASAGGRSDVGRDRAATGATATCSARPT